MTPKRHVLALQLLLKCFSISSNNLYLSKNIMKGPGEGSDLMSELSLKNRVRSQLTANG